jgi:hypothetical protein
MKITNRQLKKIIKEEKQKLLIEFGPQGTDGASPLLDFATAYSRLGSAVQEQVEDVVKAWITGGPDSPEYEDAVMNTNPNALVVARDQLTRPGRMLGGEAEDILNTLDVALQMFGELEEDATV